MRISLQKAREIGVLVLVVSMFGYTHVARAAQDEPPKKEWYGAPILIGAGIGGAALGAEAIVALHGNDVSAALWVPTAAAYLLTGPIVHIVHREYGRAVGSVGIDVGLPAAGALVAATALLFESNCDNGLPHASGPECTRVPSYVILETSFLLGPLIDGLVLARHVPKPEPAEPRAASISLSPMIVPTAPDRSGRGLTLGVSGMF